jgi:hypothetical protein
MNILWSHDNIDDYKELDIQLQNFEKTIINFTYEQSGWIGKLFSLPYPTSS